MGKNITVSELDFDQIKSNLKEFLRGQERFNSYDFEGSSLSVLLDILAYNTHYRSIYNNLSINEVFLDSASKRNSVVSRAKEKGYIPFSARCPRAVVNLRISESSLTDQVLTLPAGSVFTTVVDGLEYTFLTQEDISTVRLQSGDFLFTDVEIHEGVKLVNRYQYSDGFKAIVPNRNCDTETLVVKIQENAQSSDYSIYNRADSILDVKSDSKVYFIGEIDNGLYQIEFGNDRIGKALSPGNIIVLEYLVTNKTLANGARTFQYQGGVGNGTASITTVQAASGGAEPEDIESIRFNAPRFYAAQNRAVGPGDYEAILRKSYANIETIQVWGGEDNVPPVYGKTFICIKPKDAEMLTSSEKDRIAQEILKDKKISSIIPEFVDPEYIYVEVNSTVYYNTKLTSDTADTIKTLVLDTIQDYNDRNLEQFNKVFRFSRFSNEIDLTDESIVSNITRITLHRPVTPVYGISAKYDIQIGNPIYKSGTPDDSILSTGFYITGSNEIYYLTDDGAGMIKLFYEQSKGTRVYSSTPIGTVDYATGSIVINGLNISSLAETDFRLYISPSSNDVVAVRNNLVSIPESLVTVNVIADGLSSGDSKGGANYIFTPSRN